VYNQHFVKCDSLFVIFLLNLYIATPAIKPTLRYGPWW